MKKIVLIAALATSLFGPFAESNNQPVFYFQCEGYHKSSGKIWNIKGKENNECHPAVNPDPTDISQACDYAVEISEGNSPMKTTRRITKGMLRQDSFVIWFWPGDVPEQSGNFEGMLTIDNTGNFPSVTRFAAHGWLANNPVITSNAFNFVCEVY